MGFAEDELHAVGSDPGGDAKRGMMVRRNRLRGISRAKAMLEEAGNVAMLRCRDGACFCISEPAGATLYDGQISNY